jgi:hypothetical protein
MANIFESSISNIDKRKPKRSAGKTGNMSTICTEDLDTNMSYSIVIGCENIVSVAYQPELEEVV